MVRASIENVIIIITRYNISFNCILHIQHTEIWAEDAWCKNSLSVSFSVFQWLSTLRQCRWLCQSFSVHVHVHVCVCFRWRLSLSVCAFMSDSVSCFCVLPRWFSLGWFCISYCLCLILCIWVCVWPSVFVIGCVCVCECECVVVCVC